MIACADGATLWTTETDLDTALGRLGCAMRDLLELAVWEGHMLWAAKGQPPLAGYGRDICALPVAT